MWSKQRAYRREGSGLFVHELDFDWVLDWQVKQIKQDKDLTATLEPEEMEIVSEAVANQEADKFAKERILGAKSVTPEEQAVYGAVKEASMKLRRRSFKGFDKLFTDWQGTVDVVTTGEQKNKAAMLETLNNIIGFVVKMQLPTAVISRWRMDRCAASSCSLWKWRGYHHFCSAGHRRHRHRFSRSRLNRHQLAAHLLLLSRKRSGLFLCTQLASRPRRFQVVLHRGD
jgi:hypothetical protein